MNRDLLMCRKSGLSFFYYENIDGGHSAAPNQVERAKRTALEYTYLKNALFLSRCSACDLVRGLIVFLDSKPSICF